jgi:hypothetical protein
VTTRRLEHDPGRRRRGSQHDRRSVGAGRPLLLFCFDAE